MKYVMFSIQVADTTKMVPVIFPDFMVHKDIAKAIKTVLVNVHKFTPRIESAGDISLGVCECSGKSETLKVGSSRADNHIVNHYDYLHGLVY